MERYRQKQSRRRQRNYIIIAALVITVIVIVAVVLQSLPPTYSARTPPPPLPNMPTISSSSSLVLHIHVHLDIYLNGTETTIPSNLGHVSDDAIFYAIHTHDSSGIIHIESPVQQSFTLGQIFEVWGWPLDSGHIFDKTGPVTLYINNGGSSHSFDAGYLLQRGDEIALVYGTPPASIPSSYNWPMGYP